VLGRYNLRRTVQIRTGTSLVLVPPRVLRSARVLQGVPSRAQPTRQGTRPRSHVDMAGTAGWPGVQPNRPSRSRSQAVRQALGRLYTVVGASPRCRHIPTGTLRYRHGADRLSSCPARAARGSCVSGTASVGVCRSPFGSSGIFRRYRCNVGRDIAARLLDVCGNHG
jgi:hypothetical protein